MFFARYRRDPGGDRARVLYVRSARLAAGIAWSRTKNIQAPSGINLAAADSLVPLGKAYLVEAMTPRVLVNCVFALLG
jgi:hypothetical protein